MKFEDLEDTLRSLKVVHVSETDLTAYCDRALDPTASDRVETHLKQCFICSRELESIKEENAGLHNFAPTVEDVAFVDRLVGQPQSQLTTSDRVISGIDNPIQDRLVEYLRQMMASWQACFAGGAVRGDSNEEVVWSWQSADGNLQARATLEKTDLVIHFTSKELELEATRLQIHLGTTTHEVTLERTSHSEVSARVEIPWWQRRGDISHILMQPA
jgi:hypothetical protein